MAACPAQCASVCNIRPAGLEEAEKVMEVMHLAFEEYRGKLYPESGALGETLADVRAGIASGGAFLAFVGEAIAGSARYRVFADHVYGERIGVLPAYRGRGIAAALTRAIEAHASERGVSQVQVRVRASIPSNLRLYEKLGYRVLAREPYPIGTDVQIILARNPTT
jgi:ribosomal protein S18 acetylase RimI-like enzyme